MLKNIFSFQSEIVPIEEGDYQDALTVVLEKLPKNNLERVMLEVAEANIDVRFQLVGKIVPMSMDDTMQLLEDTRLYFQQGNELLNTDAQARLAFVVGALLEKAQKRINAGELLSAACTCVTVIRALEPLVTSVSDQGKILERLITDTFDVLRTLTKEEGDKQTFSFIALLAESQLKETLEVDQHYEKHWEELIRQYRSHINVYVKS